MPPELSTRPKYGDIHDKNEERYSICPPTVHYFQQIFDRWWLTPTMHPTFGHLNDALAHTIRWDFIEDRTYFGLRDNRVKIFVIHKHIEGQGLDMSTLIGVLAFVWVEGFPTDTQGRNCYKRSAQAFELRDPLVFGAEQIRRVYPNDQLPGYWFHHSIAIHPDYRRKGIAKAALTFTLEHLSNKRKAPFFTSAYFDERKLYEGLGFNFVQPPEDWDPMEPMVKPA